MTYTDPIFNVKKKNHTEKNNVLTLCVPYVIHF